MKKIYTLFVGILGLLSFKSQVVYSENMGSPSSTTAITSYTGWQNTGGSITYAGTGDVRTSSASSGYIGSSGGGNVFLTSTAGKYFQINGINTSTYVSSGLSLSFGYLTSTVGTQLVLEQSNDNGVTWSPLTFTNNANTSWNLVTISSGIYQANNLSLRFTQPATAQMRIDDVKLNYVSPTCSLVLGTPTAVCSASTLNIDTYTISIPFTGGGSSTYTISPSLGTVGGDNPSSVASGTILITGTNEGVNNAVNITGGTCSYSLSINAPVGGCKPINPLPFNEPFNYTVGQALSAQQTWNSLNTGDDILVTSGNLNYSGVNSTGNSVSFAGAGAESRTPFTTTNSGTIYSSMLFSCTDLSAITTDLTSSYVALYTDDVAGSTTARLWIRKNGTQYQFGLGAGTSPDTWSNNLYNVGTTQYLIFGYDFNTGSTVLYENQANPTTPTISVVNTTPLTNVGGFMLRQDAANNTPNIVLDELNISTTLQTLAAKDFSKSKINLVKNTMVKDVVTFGAKAQVKIVNMNGQIIKSASVDNGASLDVSSLSKGVYIIKGEVNGETVSQKIIKQ